MVGEWDMGDSLPENYTATGESERAMLGKGKQEQLKRVFPWARIPGCYGQGKSVADAQFFVRDRVTTLAIVLSTRKFAELRIGRGTWSSGIPSTDKSGRCRSPRLDKVCASRSIRLPMRCAHIPRQSHKNKYIPTHKKLRRQRL